MDLGASQAIAEEKHPPSAQELTVAAALLTEQSNAFPRGVKRAQVREIDAALLQILGELEATLHAGQQTTPLCYAVLLLNSLRTVRAIGLETRPAYAVRAELDFAKAVHEMETLQAKHAQVRDMLRALGSNEDLDVKELHARHALAESNITLLRQSCACWRSSLEKDEQMLATLSPELLATLRQVCAPVIDREI